MDEKKYREFCKQLKKDLEADYDEVNDEIALDTAKCLMEDPIDPEIKAVAKYLESKGYKTAETKAFKLANDIY